MSTMKITRRQVFQNSRTGEVRAFPRGSSVTSVWKLLVPRHVVPVSRSGLPGLVSV